MSTYSSGKRLENDITEYETESDRKVLSTDYFIVRCTVGDDENLDVTAFVKDTLTDCCAIAGYVYLNEVYLIFSCLDEEEHMFGGSHHMLCSYYVSKLARRYGVQTWCYIIEIDTRIKVLTYLQFKVSTNLRRTLARLSKGKITKDMTLIESVEKLSTIGVSWDQVPPAKKWGIFYKYIPPVKSGTGKFITLSEQIDFRNIDRYTSYFFD